MKNKNLKFKYMDIIDVDITLTQNYTVLNGDSATGKSYLYEVLSSYALENPDENLICLDDSFIGRTDQALNIIKNADDAIIVIDQANILLDHNELERYIDHDVRNYYVIMSRHFAKRYSELAKPVITKNSISIKYKLNTVRR